jgi:hypothetical protein
VWLLERLQDDYVRVAKAPGHTVTAHRHSREVVTSARCAAPALASTTILPA